MKSSTNVFSGGITTDMHPLTMQLGQLSDALNATILTFNGNELVLQNDMGNTLIQDSTTGNIMSLREGFIPVGMKEHAGVLYIASYNPTTNKGELGSIPSPNIQYTFDECPTTYTKETKVTDISTGNTSNINQRISSLYIPITDAKLGVGDRFIVQLNIKELLTTGLFNRAILDKANNTNTQTYPLITKFGNNDSIEYGWYKIDLYSQLESGSFEKLTSLYTTRQLYYINTDSSVINSDYWFIDSTAPYGVNDIDINKCIENKVFRTYPNIPRGKLFIKVTLELPENIQLIKNTSTKVNSPFTYISTKI